MDGTTLCPHCETRFKIAVSQLAAHQGLVRCGHCLQVFDARPNFIPDQPHPQLELAIHEAAAVQPSEAHHPSLNSVVDKPVSDVGERTAPNAVMPDESVPSLLEQDQVEDDDGFRPKQKKSWIWVMPTLVLFLLLIGQSAYYFRVDIAARVPVTTSMLTKYCELLACTITLPQKSEFMSIESSSLEADPGNAAQITLTALLRNHASYTLAFPNLELTLNDRQDKAVGRRIFRPSDYLPPGESEQSGLQSNHELSLKLLLNTNDLNPNGYRLVVLYPAIK